MNDRTWPATPSSSHATFHNVGFVVREREELRVGGLGRLDRTPVIAEGLDIGLPDRAQLIVPHRPDLDAVRKRVIGEALDGGPHHLG